MRSSACKVEIMLGRFLESNHYFFGRVGGGGWEEKWRLRLNSAQFQVKLPAGAELGNIMFFTTYFTKVDALGPNFHSC